MTADNYRQIHTEAQAEADASGCDMGIEKLGGTFRWFRLPRAENRFGYELRCEVVHPMRLEKCQPGHGPTAKLDRSRGWT